MPKYGYFVNPAPNALSDLQNDNNYLAIREYPLTKDILSGESSFAISDLKAGSTIVKMTVNVKSPFTSEANNDAIEVVTDSGETLLSKNINDMNVTGNYMTDCYYVTNGNENELVVNHTLKSDPNKFVAISGGEIPSNYFAYSTDGITWTEGTISDTERMWCSICYGNDKFVTVGYNLDSDGNPTSGNNYAYSTDGINWTEGTISSTSRVWRSVCYGNDKFVAVTNVSKYFAYSTDGITWTEGIISDTIRQWMSVCYGNGKFVTVASSSNYFAYSTDGITWTEGTISDTSRNWESNCYGNDKFVAVAFNTNYFAYSTDGINWTEGTISDTSRQWRSVCYGNGKFVTVGWTKYFAYSTDGINWTEGTISSTNRLWMSICYGNDKFVVVDCNYDEDWNPTTDYFSYSTDGINWTESTISDTGRWWVSVCCSNNPEISYGDAVLRLEIFETLPEYNELLTSDNEPYTTSDNVTTEVTK